MSDSCVYRLFDANDVLLYVGCTGNLDARLTAHACTKKWWGDVVRHEADWYDTRGEALVAERAAITTEGPLYNNEIRSKTTDPLGVRIKTIRDARGLSQERLARQLGVSLRTVIRYENSGSRCMTLRQIETMADALEVPLSDLLPVRTAA